MLVLFETAAGFAIFKLLDQNKLVKSENLYLDFQTPEAANKIIKLKYFHKYEDITEALACTTALLEGKLSKSLKKALKNCCTDLQEEIAVADKKLGKTIIEKLQLPCVYNTSIQELMRCIRNQTQSLITEVNQKEMAAMALGLAHSLSRYKLKFSPDKVDIMVIQAICLLDELDKQVNNYIMRAREWYGWHFPELSKIVKENIKYIKTIHILGLRENSLTCDLSDILDEDTEVQVKEAAQTSMGSEISLDDITHMQLLCDEIIELHNYRNYLADYLKNRMMALSPNLTVLVGDLVGARLISKAGSLTNLAKHPASTLQILGAEKALFRALKSKKNTPKYGLIYHSQLVGQSSNKNKGKISRMLAAKASLAARVDALGSETNFNLGIAHKAKLEQQLKFLEKGNQRRISGTTKAKAKFEKYYNKNEYMQYATSADSTLPNNKKPLIEEIKQTNDTETQKTRKHKLTEDVEESFKQEVETIDTEVPKKKKKKAKQSLDIKTEEGESSIVQEVEQTINTETPKKKKKRQSLDIKTEEGESSNIQEELQLKTEEDSVKPKKKKKRSIEDTEDHDATSSMQLQIDADIVPKKKSKKKKQNSDESKESIKIEDTTLEANVSYEVELSETAESKGDKKKKKKQKEIQEMQETPISIEVEKSVSSEKKKKKKKSHD